MKVLIVEDEVRLGLFLKQGLSEHAHTANWVPNCREANHALVETNYDLIVLDLNLPDGDGLDLVREWRDRRPPATGLIPSVPGSRGVHVDRGPTRARGHPALVRIGREL